MRKHFQFLRDSDGNVVRQVPMGPETAEIMQEAIEDCRSLYGRDSSPNDLVFTFRAHPAESVYRMVRVMRDADLPEDFVYAYCKTDGLLPTEMNLDLIADVDLDEFEAYRREYLRLIKGPDSGRNPSAVWFVVNGDHALRSTLASATTRLQMVFTDFLNRNAAERTFVDFTVKTPRDYGLFSAFKTCKTLDSIQRLTLHGMTESIYALSRGIFENYLYLNAMAADSEFFATKIEPRLDRDSYTFAIDPDGHINYNRVLHKESARASLVRVSLRSLLQYADPVGAELYEVFYRTACQFIHVDVLSARAYFYDPDPYDELDQALLAYLVAVVLIGMVLRALSQLSGIDERFESDVTYFLGTLHEDIAMLIELAKADPEHQNAVFQTLSTVVERWRTA